MSYTHAREAVIEWLVAPAAPVDRKSPGAHDPGAGGWRARTLPGKPYVAQRETIAIVKERSHPDRRLFATTFVDLDGAAWSYLVAAERSEGGWSAHDVAGGSDGPGKARTRRAEPSQPKADVFGQWGPGVLYVGAEVRGDRQGVVAAVRLTLVDGTELTEDASGGLALFVARRGAEPDVVHLLGARGAVLTTHDPF